MDTASHTGGMDAGADAGGMDADSTESDTSREREGHTLIIHLCLFEYSLQ